MDKGSDNVSVLDGNRFEFPPPQELKLKLKDLLESEIDESYYLKPERLKAIANWKAYQKPFEHIQGNNSIVPTLTARGAGEEHSGMITYSDKLDETTNLQVEILRYGLYDFSSSDRFANNQRDLGERDLMNTLRVKPQLGIYSLKDFRIRKLTPKECWRLMGFDDEDYEKASKVNSNTQLYKQAGNSIVVNVLEAILSNLLGGKNENNK